MDLLQAFTNLISDVYDAIISAGSAVMQFAEQLGVLISRSLRLMKLQDAEKLLACLLMALLLHGIIL